MNPESDLAVVIPTKNDESTIGSLVLLLCQMVNHVIVVDDSSEDRTMEVAQYAGAEVVSVDSYGGSGRVYAILVGCRRALENGCSAVILMDSQGEAFVRELFRVASPVLSGKADLVIGSRQFFGRKTISLRTTSTRRPTPCPPRTRTARSGAPIPPPVSGRSASGR